MTERKTDPDRAALLEEKQFSERLIDCLPGTFYLYDSDLRLRRWNKNLEAASGYTAEELSGMNLRDWCRPEERERVLFAAKHLLEEGDAIDFLEMEMRRKDGSGTPYLVSGAHVDSPTGPMLVGVGIDIAARVKAERALAASECNYRELFDATNDALVIHDESGCLLDVNARACAMFGIEPSQVQHLSVNDLSLGEPPYSQSEALTKLRQAMNEGPQVFDWRSRRADGSLFWSEVALRTFHFGDSRELRVIASVRDITERKLADLENQGGCHRKQHERPVPGGALPRASEPSRGDPGRRRTLAVLFESRRPSTAASGGRHRAQREATGATRE
jgi:PAS domain S-box-containing protein